MAVQLKVLIKAEISSKRVVSHTIMLRIYMSNVDKLHVKTITFTSTNEAASKPTIKIVYAIQLIANGSNDPMIHFNCYLRSNIKGIA